MGAVVIFIGVLALAAVSRAVRVLLGLLALGAVGLVLFLWHDSQERQRRETEVDFTELRTDVRLDGTTLRGRLTNTDPSGATMRRVTFRVRVRECKDCVVLGEDTQTVVVNIPSGQARDFSQMFYALPSRPYGSEPWVWDYDLLTVQGEKTSGLR